MTSSCRPGQAEGPQRQERGQHDITTLIGADDYHFREIGRSKKHDCVAAFQLAPEAGVLIGGNVRRNATIASRSAGARFAYQVYGIVWLSLVPSGRTPSTSVRLICSSLHLPIPCSGSVVMLRLMTTPAGG